jgi:hypothetical protein
VVRHPDRYMDERGTVMWTRVMELVKRAEAETTRCCSADNTPPISPNSVTSAQ